MDKKLLHRAPALIAVAAVLPIMLGACGGSGSSSSDAPGTQPSAGAGAGTSTAQAGAAQFAQCMRSNGVTDFPDPSNGRFLIPGDVQSNPHFQSAVQACQHFLGPGGISGNNGQRAAAELAFAQCMQTHGEPNWPDPQPDGALVAPSGIDTNSPTYKNAFSACKSKLPDGGSGLQG